MANEIRKVASPIVQTKDIQYEEIETEVVKRRFTIPQLEERKQELLDEIAKIDENITAANAAK